MARKTGYTIITPKALDLLELLYRYKYLRTSFIRQLLDCGEQGIINQLKRRREQGYCFKPREQLRGYNNLWSPRIHSITKKGEQLLIEHDRHPFKATRLHRAKGDAPVKNFAHAMMICDTLASIEIGINKTDCKFIPWTQIVAKLDHPDPMRLEFDTTYEGKRVKDKMVPDGMFGIQYPNGQASFFLLESENFNPIEPKDLNRASFLKKIIGYKDIKAKGTYKQLGIPNMHVLFVFPTPARVQTAKELVERIYGETSLFLLHDIPVQELLFKAPPPFPELLTSNWKRGGLEPIPLYTQLDR